MKILHVITGLQKAAGTSVFCGEVCNGLVAAGHEVTIAVVDAKRADIHTLDPRVKLLTIDSLLTGSAGADWSVVHIHALWSPILHKVSNWAHANKIPVVWSPHGMLTSWAMRYKWWKKFPAWWLYQKRDLAQAALLHATAQSEVNDIRRVGLKNRVVIAPLGVKINGEYNTSDGGGCLFVSRIQRKKGLVNLIYAWAELVKNIKYIGRIAPIKNLDSLSRAFARVASEGWRLVIVGPDQENHAAELKALAQELGVSESVQFTGPKYGEDLQKAYADADIFVLPSFSENFGSVVIEALANGVPVITTKGTPWQELEERKCGWWIDIGVEPLAAALKAAMSLSDAERREMGVRGRSLVEEKYTWDAVVKAMVKGYESVLSASH